MGEPGRFATARALRVPGLSRPTRPWPGARPWPAGRGRPAMAPGQWKGPGSRPTVRHRLRPVSPGILPGESTRRGEGGDALER
eukprot:1448787-Pyramimonas_sp.AAC.1